jgi:hypothetical protein
MGIKSRRKGTRVELEMVRHLEEAGFAAERVPLSGAHGGRFNGDISLPLMGRDLRVEIKARATGFRSLYSWLSGSDIVILRADRQPALVVTPIDLWTAIAVAAEHSVKHCNCASNADA